MAELDAEMSRPGFWDTQERARRVVSERAGLLGTVGPLDEVTRALEDCREIVELFEADGAEEDGASHGEAASARVDGASLGEIESDLADVEARLEKVEIRATLSGPDDRKTAFLRIHAGAGGTDSCDWAQMLLRMYLRYIEGRGLEGKVVDVLPNDEAGIRSATVRVTGEYAYGYLKSEIGVHRLVRISQFDAAKRRHTSFASVDVLPEAEDIEIEVNDKDLRIDVFRASGKGGQKVNVTDSAVRITHLPTGIVVSCQNERSQYQNKAVAMKILRSRIRRYEEAKRERELAKLYSEKGEIAWGNQIRSYTLQPFQLVKDHRTGLEIGNVQSVLDGEIAPLVDAQLRRTAGGASIKNPG